MGRFNETRRGYKFDKYIFWVTFLIICSGIFALFYVNDFNTSPNFYVKCNYDFCPNPLKLPEFECQNELKILWFITLYKDEDCTRNCIEPWCDMETLPRGEYGKKQPLIMALSPLIAFLIFVISFFVNHFMHNKGKKFDMEVRITKNKRITRDNLKFKDDDKP